MEEKNFLIASLLISFVLILGAVFFLSKSGATLPPRIIDSSILIRDGVHGKGNTDAKVTIVEFSDFQCPACKLAYGEMKKVQDTYKDKVRFIYRNYPLVMVHKYSQQTANAAEFAAESGKFWEWHDLLFDKQDEWGKVTDDKKFEELMISYANSLGLDDKKMLEVMETNKYNDKIQRDVDDGNRVGLTGTPTIFVNGEEISGYSFDEIKRLVEKNLK